MNRQIYCTEAEVIADLGLNGRDGQLLSRIQSASRFINRRFGDFYPVTATKYFDGDTPSTGSLHLTEPLLSVTEVKNNDTAVTDYDLYPLNRYWENGPYMRLWSDTIPWDEVEISGTWGKWSETAALGITGTQAASSTATLAVTDGSLVSPGMVLLIGSEQELVTGWGSVTAATSLLNETLTAADEEVTVDNGAEFNEGEVIQIGTEDLYIRMVRANVLVCGRGWNGTTKAAHADNSPISVYRTVTVERGVNGTTAAAHTSADIYRQMVPYDLNWLARSIAGLMVKKAQSGFAGKVGNAELGETFYFNEFPSQVKEIARNYRITTL